MGSFVLDLTRFAKDFFAQVKSRNMVAPKSISYEEDGLSLVNFSNEEIGKLSLPFITTLVGKFTNDIPNLIKVSQSLAKLDLKGKYTINFFNPRNVIIRCFGQEDFEFLWLKNAISVGNCPMRILKWSPNFFDKDSPILPIWLSLKHVPIML